MECKCPKRRTLTFLDRGNLDFVFKKYSCNGGLYEGFRLVNMIVEWVIRLSARQCWRIFQMFKAHQLSLARKIWSKIKNYDVFVFKMNLCKIRLHCYVFIIFTKVQRVQLIWLTNWLISLCHQRGVKTSYCNTLLAMFLWSHLNYPLKDLL